MAQRGEAESAKRTYAPKKNIWNSKNTKIKRSETKNSKQSFQNIKKNFLKQSFAASF